MAKRGRKAKLETREEIEKARGKSTIKFVKTDYRGIFKKIKVDENGKKIRDSRLAKAFNINNV